MRTFQAEDEIAAIGSAIGAAFGGALALTASSGPGIALKGEAMGLAVMVELPLVVVDVQRAGPSTGLPTKTEQSDLLQAMFGRKAPGSSDKGLGHGVDAVHGKTEQEGGDQDARQVEHGGAFPEDARDHRQGGGVGGRPRKEEDQRGAGVEPLEHQGRGDGGGGRGADVKGDPHHQHDQHG